MRLSFNKYLAITVTLLCFSNFSSAGTVTSCADKKADQGAGSSFDYGDATTDSEGKAYKQACHETNAWQQLGSAGANGIINTTNDVNSANEGWNGEGSQKSEDTGDNGVTWRVADENGVFGAYGHPELTQGQTVQFKFDVTRSQRGTHEFDQLSAWVDWNGKDGFNNKGFSNPKSERLIKKKWAKNKNINDKARGDYTMNRNNDLSNKFNQNIFNHVDTFRSYEVTTTIPMDAIVGQTWLRARIVCENSLTNYAKGNTMNLLATGYHDQGETEDYQLTINARAATPVPEPTTLLVFGTALIGLVLSRKKAK